MARAVLPLLRRRLPATTPCPGSSAGSAYRRLSGHVAL